MTNDRQYYVYILANQRNGTLYVGVTNNIIRRMIEHREGSADSFTKKYGVTQLVHLETTPYINNALEREKQLKNWKRAWKMALIEETNPTWQDLSKDFPNCEITKEERERVQ